MQNPDGRGRHFVITRYVILDGKGVQGLNPLKTACFHVCLHQFQPESQFTLERKLQMPWALLSKPRADKECPIHTRTHTHLLCIVHTCVVYDHAGEIFRFSVCYFSFLTAKRPGPLPWFSKYKKAKSDGYSTSLDSRQIQQTVAT